MRKLTCPKERMKIKHNRLPLQTLSGPLHLLQPLIWRTCLDRKGPPIIHMRTPSLIMRLSFVLGMIFRQEIHPVHRPQATHTGAVQVIRPMDTQAVQATKLYC